MTFFYQYSIMHLIAVQNPKKVLKNVVKFFPMTFFTSILIPGLLIIQYS